MAIVKRIGLNATAGAVEKLLVASNQLVIVPFFLFAWGPELYSEWIILIAIPTVLSISNVGFGTAAATEIIHALGKGENEKANKLLWTTAAFCALICLVLLTVIYFIPWEGLWEWNFIENANAVSALMALSVCFGILSQPLDGFWTANNKAFWAMMFRNMRLLSNLLVTVTVLYVGCDALTLAATLSCVSAVWFLIYFASSFWLMNIARPAFSLSLLKGIFSKGIGFQLAPLWQGILFQGSLWIAGLTLGPTGPATWGTVRALTRSGNQLLSTVNLSILPELQNAFAAQDLTLAKKLHSIGVVSGFIVGCLAAVGMTIFAPFIYPVWTGNTLDVPFAVWPLAGIGLILNACWWTSSTVHRAANMPWLMNMTGLVASVLTCILMYALSNSALGIVGFALGALVFELVLVRVVLTRSLCLLGDTKVDCVSRGVNILFSRVISLAKRSRKSGVKATNRPHAKKIHD